VTQRFESLATLVMVLSAAAYARLRNTNDRRWLIAVLGFGVMAAFSKETAVVLPVWIVLMEVVFFRTLRWDRRFLFLVPVGVVLAIPAWRAFTGSGVTLTSVPLHLYLASQGGVLLKYLQLSLYPYEQFLFYDVGVVTGFSWTIVLEWGVVLSVLTTGIVLIRRYPTIGFGIVSFFVMLLPVTLLPLPDLIFEHRIYPGFVGLALAAGSILILKVRRATIVLMAVLLLVFCFRTFERSAEWNDEVQFLEAHRERFPHDPQALATLAVYYFGRGEVASGIEALRTAREHEDHFNDYYATTGRVNIALNLARMYISASQDDLAREEVELALILAPDEPAVYQLAGGFHLTVGELDAALSNYIKLTELNPSGARGWMGLNQTYLRLEDEANAAVALSRLEDMAAARPDRAGWQVPPEYRTQGLFGLLLILSGAVVLAVRTIWVALRTRLAHE
jgi:tetratricopeptide (TPR) repeat protein